MPFWFSPFRKRATLCKTGFVQLELLDEAAELRGHFGQLLGGFEGVGCPLRGILPLVQAIEVFGALLKKIFYEVIHKNKPSS
jgi:hypothetical protein